jgi:hypothetical protein
MMDELALDLAEDVQDQGDRRQDRAPEPRPAPIEAHPRSADLVGLN